MNGYMWFHASRSLSSQSEHPPRREPRTWRPDAALGLLLLLATLVMTYAALTG